MVWHETHFIIWMQLLRRSASIAEHGDGQEKDESTHDGDKDYNQPHRVDFIWLCCEQKDKICLFLTSFFLYKLFFEIIRLIIRIIINVCPKSIHIYIEKKNTLPRAMVS